MKKLMTAMLALSFLGATAIYAQVPTNTTTAAKKAKKTAEKKDTAEAKTKAPKKMKAKKTTEEKK